MPLDALLVLMPGAQFREVLILGPYDAQIHCLKVVFLQLGELLETQEKLFAILGVRWHETVFLVRFPVLQHFAKAGNQSCNREGCSAIMGEAEGLELAMLLG